MSKIIDFHSHILPGIDDGSARVSQSVTMLRMSARQGVTHIVATPHFYAYRDDLPRFMERRDRAERLLRQEMGERPGMPQVHVGAEVSYFRGISESELLPQLTIRGTKCILIEMPPPPWSDEAYKELEGVSKKWGLTPVIAHIDRYIGPLRTYGIPKRLAQLPVLVQANGDFFLNWLTAPLAMKLLKAGKIHLLGSDCHNTTKRKPNLGHAVNRITKKLGPAAAKKLWVQASELLKTQ